MKIRFPAPHAIDAPFPHRNRNDALDQVQLLRDELDYLKKNPAETPEDVVAAQRQAVKAFDNYFALAPADDAPSPTKDDVLLVEEPAWVLEQAGSRFMGGADRGAAGLSDSDSDEF